MSAPPATPDLRASRLHAVVGPSVRLRDELLAGLIVGWAGPIKRLVEPADVDRIVLDLDTPSLFEPPALWVLRGDERWVKKHRERLAPLIGAPVAGGAVILVSSKLDDARTRDSLTKALSAAGVLRLAAVPQGEAALGFVIERLARVAPPGGSTSGDAPARIAQALLDRVGDDADTLLATLDTAALYAGDAPLTLAAIAAVAPGLASRPIWDFTGALLGGDAARAIELYHADRDLEPDPALGAIASELRKLLACTATSDDAAAHRLAGSRTKSSLYYARQRARSLGRDKLVRILRATVHAQGQLRRSGSDGDLAIEQLVLHAQRIVSPGGSPVGGGARGSGSTVTNQRR